MALSKNTQLRDTQTAVLFNALNDFEWQSFDVTELENLLPLNVDRT